MIKAITTFLLGFILTPAAAQSKVSTYLSAQYSRTLYDRTKGNNPGGTGLGIQAFLNTGTKFRPSLELTGDIYLEDDKVLRFTPDGKEIKDKNGVVNFFGGLSFSPIRSAYISLLAGPSFINGKTFAGIKPSLGFYFSSDKKWAGKISYINIFQNDQVSNQDFGSICFAIELKLS